MSNPARIYAFQNQAYFSRQPFPQPRREVRSKYASISNQQNFMDPFSIFQGFMSGALKEEDQNLFPAVSTFNYFKRISEVLHHKDRKVISAYLENDPIWTATTWAEVVENFGMEQAENMSKLIDTFGSSMDKLRKLSEYLKSTGIKTDFESRKEDFDKLRAKYERELPCFYIKNVIKRRNPTIVEYNNEFLTFLGYNPKEFASNILRHGIPEIYPNMQKKYAGMVKEVVEILLEGKQGIKPIVKQVYLLRADLQIIFVKETTYLMRSLNQNQELELELFFMYEQISEPMKVEEEFKALVQPKPRIAPQPTPVKMEQEHEKDEFLKKFYNIKKKDENELARTCKIRYL